MKRLKELGLNGINFAAIVCPIEMMEAADELGVILQCGDQVTRDEGNQNIYQGGLELDRGTTRKHPSLSIYGFGGELKYYEGVIEQYKAQMDSFRGSILSRWSCRNKQFTGSITESKMSAHRASKRNPSFTTPNDSGVTPKPAIYLGTTPAGRLATTISPHPGA